MMAAPERPQQASSKPQFVRTGTVTKLDQMLRYHAASPAPTPCNTQLGQKMNVDRAKSESQNSRIGVVSKV